jgi:hypothetical protein
VAAADGVAIALDNPEDIERLESNQDLLAQKLAEAKPVDASREDFSDMVAEHQAGPLAVAAAPTLCAGALTKGGLGVMQAKAAAKRKKQTEKSTTGTAKKFKF